MTLPQYLITGVAVTASCVTIGASQAVLMTEMAEASAKPAVQSHHKPKPRKALFHVTIGWPYGKG